MRHFLLLLFVLCTCCAKLHATSDTLPCDSPAVYLPNHFIPQCESLDCDFRPVFTCAPAEYEMKIYNRWGELLFTTKDFQQGWNGEKEKVPCAYGDYYCKITFRYREGEEQRTMTGSFTLIR